ncbi:unnamed protein product [Acanthoscelides obtectus]|uniref:DUF4774 domain-containing protein n=1 Tax=Acanthoscelides obtectus TaxID=200917 RepID=A0A9P0LIJ5_ACAOB|nr:unnamed protein product [Acanthoscelides obtectus]CAK1664335.1 hypothetical protein AOBTE_LOCUS24206 [Acanthoscelides obtectus]
MLKLLLIPLILQAALVSSQSRQNNDQSRGAPGLRPILMFIERLLDTQASNQQPRALKPQLQGQTQSQQPQQSQSQQPQQPAPQATPQTVQQTVQPPTQQPIQLIYQGVPPLFQPTILPQFPFQQLQLPLQITGQSGVQQQSGQGQQSGQQQQVVQVQPSPQQVQQQQYVRLLDPNQQQQRPRNLTVPLPQPAQPPPPNVYQHLFGRQQLFFQDPNQPGGFPGQYGYNYIHDKQRQPGVYGRVPQFFVYRPDQPILINPGQVPGNFLPPTGPGVLGGPGLTPGVGGRNPFFVGGGGQPARPNFVPPVEKDAEEIPTDPSKIPPFNGGKGSGQTGVKPEKLETLDEGKPEFTTKSVGDPDVNHQQYPSYGPKPGHKFFFVLNGQTLLPHSAFEKYNGYSLADEQHGSPNKEELHSNIPEEYRDIPQKDEQHHEVPAHHEKGELQNNIPHDYAQHHENGFRDSKYYSDDPQNFFGAEHGLFFRNSGSADQGHHQPEQFRYSPVYGVDHDQGQHQSEQFRYSPPEDIAGQGQGKGRQESGQFRYSPPSDPYLPFGDETENDSVVVDANLDDRNTRGSGESKKQESHSATSQKEDADPTGDPSTAQAAPGAVAIAGPGGVAGASPKATALAGKRGLAVSSPHATAVAGTEGTKHGRRRTKPSKSDNK